MWRTIILAVLLLVGLTSYYSKNVVKPEDKGKTADILEEHLILEEVPSERDLAHIRDLSVVEYKKAKSPTPDIKTANLTPRTSKTEGLGVTAQIPEVFEAQVTAYNSVPEQTDSTPCWAAGGYICGRDDVVACPRRYPLGTKVEIKGKIYECQDRLALKFDHRFDIFMDKDLEGARAFGLQRLKIKILYE